MRTIAVVTVGRSDFGIYRPILRRLIDCADLSLQLLVAGAHLAPEFGLTVQEIEREGFGIAERIDLTLSGDTAVAIAKSMGLGVIGFAQAYERIKPNILLLLGDRFEMHAAGAAAVPFGITIAHIHGGEVSEGAMDDAWRHALTKYAHLHFVSTSAHARRVQQLGEEPWRVTITGAPALDNLKTMKYLERGDLEERVGLRLHTPPLIVTYHPVTLQHQESERRFGDLLSVLAEVDRPLVMTRPNADTGARSLIPLAEEFCRRHPQARLHENLGTLAYFSLMRLAAAMVGNSSSGIIEAASFELPVLNIGIRQQGRTRSANIVDVGNTPAEIRKGLAQVLNPGFRESLRGMVNVYGQGGAAQVIVERLRTERLDDRLRIKKFCDV